MLWVITIASLLAIVAVLAAALWSCLDDYRDVETKLISAQVRIAELTDQNKYCQADLAKAQAEAREFSRRFNELQHDEVLLQSYHKVALEQRDKAAMEADKLRADLQAAKELATTLQDDVDAAYVQVNSLLADYANLQDLNRESNKQQDDWKKECGRLRSRLIYVLDKMGEIRNAVNGDI